MDGQIVLLAELAYLGVPYVDILEIAWFDTMQACITYTEINGDNEAYDIYSNWRLFDETVGDGRVLDQITLGCSTIDLTH